VGELGALFQDSRAQQPTARDIDWLVSQLPTGAGTLLVASADAGRLLLALTHRGLHVHGIDASQAAIAQCESRLRSAGHVTPVYRQDVDTLNLPFRYAGAVIEASVWQRVQPTRISEALHRLRAHLIGPGMLIVEVTIPEYAEHPPGAAIVEVYRVKLDDGSVITRRSEQRVNADARCADITERYERRSGAAVTAREDARFTLNWHTAPEMMQLLSEAGFTTIRSEERPSREGTREARRFAVIGTL
jgi:hypothetical protein